jgi:hypothetical protein
VTQESFFFREHGVFSTAHTSCPSGRAGVQTVVWMPADRPDECYVVFTCPCGAHLELPATRAEAMSIAEALRMSGSAVTESDRAKDGPEEPRT